MFLVGAQPESRFRVAIVGQVIALALSVAAFASTLQAPGYRAVQNFTWFTFGEQTLRIGFVLDPLAAAMLVMITLVGLCIFVFSVGYMQTDKNFTRFFAYLSFFSAAMLGVVIANSLLLLFVSWELVGLASYLLIGFWIEKPSAAAAAKKAFITTRIGDLGFFLGLLWLYGKSGTLLFYDNGHGCIENAALVSLGASATFIALLIFCGAVGKSGQFPLHVWLPDAMEGPTPVSALIHAATMVAAGVFLVARVYPLFSLGAVHGVTPSLTVVRLDRRHHCADRFAHCARAVRYQTHSRLLHRLAARPDDGVVRRGRRCRRHHAFDRARIFQGAPLPRRRLGHSRLHHEQDIRKMGGLRFVMPITFITYAVGVMKLSGVPFFFSGAWTKEEILHATAHWHVSHLPYYLMLVGVVLTALYMTRQIIYVFLGNRHVASVQAHESPNVMTRPLIVLAVCSILLVGVLTPAWPWFSSYLNGERATFRLALLVQPMILVSLALVAAGFLLGWSVYRKAEERGSSRAGTAVPLSHSRKQILAGRALRAQRNRAREICGRVADWMDRHVWDGLVRLTGALGGFFGTLTKGFDETGINAGADGLTNRARGFGRALSTRHSGQIQTYLGALAIGMLALLLLYAWLT